MKLLLFLGLLAALAFAGDVAAENAAEGRIEDRLASSFEEAEEVEVDIGGTLFVPQLFGGSFERVEVRLTNVSRGSLTARRVTIELKGLGFSPSDLIKGKGGISVNGGRGRAVFTEQDIARALADTGSGVTIALDGGATVSSAAGSTAVDSISVEDGNLSFAAPPLDPLVLALPETLNGVTYVSARVVNGRLVVPLTVERGAVSL